MFSARLKKLVLGRPTKAHLRFTGSLERCDIWIEGRFEAGFPGFHKVFNWFCGEFLVFCRLWPISGLVVDGFVTVFDW